MIHYQLRCGQAHEFDGWFRDSDAFAKQAAAQLVQCPQCGDTGVTRALMAPSLGRKNNRSKAGLPVPPPPPAAVPASAPPAAAPEAGMHAAMPDGLRAALQKLRATVEKECEHVGPNFAAEARAIHRGEKEARGIYGDATPEQAEALAEEGIEIAAIPWVKRADG